MVGNNSILFISTSTGAQYQCLKCRRKAQDYVMLTQSYTQRVGVGGVVRTTYGRDPDGNIFKLQEITAVDLPTT